LVVLVQACVRVLDKTGRLPASFPERTLFVFVLETVLRFTKRKVRKNIEIIQYNTK